MAGRSDVASPSEAFELFLDTLCNAFGGIIFISLLVCVILQSTTKSIEPPTPAVRVDQITGELRTCHSAIDLLLIARERQEKQLRLTKAASNPELLEEYTKLTKRDRELRKKYQELMAALGELKLALAKTDISLAEALRRRKKLTDEKEALQKILETLRQLKLTLRLPKFQPTNKKPVPVLLSGGRMIFVMQYNNSGESTACNTDDIIVLTDDDGDVKAIRPKAGRGIAVQDRAGLEQALAGNLAKFTNNPRPGKTEEQCQYFNVIVWPDSYSQFEVLRDLLIEKDYAYNVVLQEKGQPVPVGDNVVTGVQ